MVSGLQISLSFSTIVNQLSPKENIFATVLSFPVRQRFASV